jgi:hypothetical protein
MIKILKTEHPRLFIDNERIKELKELGKKDIFFQQLMAGLFKRANRLVKEKVVEFKITGPRMLKNCQEIHSRVETLALSWLLTGDKTFALRAKDELLSAAAFPHWNKDHFLDTAELITAFAIGYDWLFNALPENELKTIKNAMVNKGIREGLAEHKNNIWWAGHKYNWNQVCNGSLIIGSLAIADEEPQLCSEVFDSTTKFLPIAFNSYGKEGGWEGGPDYWQYTTWFSALLIDALQKVTGNDFDLSKTPGFDKTGLFPIYTAGPADRYFNFGDADEDYKALPVLFWLGKKFNIDDCINENHRLLQKAIKNNAETDPFNLIWYEPAKTTNKKLPLNRIFGDVNTGYMRSKWEEPEATFIAFKGGNNQADHAHLDLGSFVLDMNGVRWASELGRDNYDLPGYFDLSEEGGRWKYFRLNTRSHNTLLLNNDKQRAAAIAKITGFHTLGGESEAKIDLSEAYAPYAKSVIRTIKLSLTSEVVVTDKIEWAGNEKLARWQMLTDAEIVLSGNKANLIKIGKKITATIIQPIGAVFEVISAEQEVPEMKNKGFKQLVVQKLEKKGHTLFEIRFEPGEKK